MAHHPYPSRWALRGMLLSVACFFLIGANLLFGGGVAFTATSSPILVVSPASFNGNTSCTYSGTQGWSCTANLSRGDALAKNLAWSASSAPGIIFTPASGVLPAGGKASVTISVPNRVCPASLTFTFKGPANTVQVPWSCGSPTLTVTPTAFTAGTNCPGGSNGWTCTATVGETASSQGNLPWSVQTSLSGVTFSPPGGILTPGSSTKVSIFVPKSACSNSTFTFVGLKSNTVSVAWNCSPPPAPKLVVSPTSLTQSSTQCTSTNGNYQCSVLLQEPATSVGNINWSTSTSLSGVTFTPANGTLAPGQSTTVVIGSIPCQNGTFSFSGQAGVSPVQVSWSCTPPPPVTLSVTPTSLGPTNTNCLATSSTYQCKVTLNAQGGTVTWSASSDLGSGVTFTPSNGTVSPGTPVTVSIGSIPCQNGTFTFSGQTGVSPVKVAWSCTPPPPTLTVTPTSLDPTSTNCLATGSTSQCSLTLNAQGGTVNWSVTTDLGSNVTFSPAGGAVSPGTPVTASIGSIPCQNGTFTFSGQTGVGPVKVTWSCTPPPTLTVTPTSLDPTNTNCSATGSNYQCSVTLNVQGSAVNWSVSSDLGSSVTFTPATGTVSPGNVVSVSIAGLPCQNGTLTFSGQSGVSSVPVSWSCTPPPPPPNLTVTPTSLDQSSCKAESSGSGTYSCSVTLGETASSQGNINWSVTTDLGSSVTFSPSSGTLSPGSPQTVTIGSIPCQAGSFTFSGQTGISPVKVAWSCTPPPPTLSVNPTSLDQSSANCAAAAGSTYHCAVTLSAQGAIVHWSVSSDLGSGVTFSPASGDLAPGNAASVSIDGLPCKNGTLTFSGQTGVSSVPVPWSCTPPPPPPTLSVTPTSLDQSSCKADSSGTGTYSCSVTVGETASSQGNINWSVTSDLGTGVTFSPAASGTISPTSPQTFTIGSIPCQNGTFTFSGQAGVSPVKVTWSCTPPPPVLSVSPTSLDQTSANCSAAGSTYHCAVALNAQGAVVHWSASSDLGSGVSFSPTSGDLAAGNSASVSIDGLPCKNGTLTFSGQTGVSPITVAWSCTPPPPAPTLTVTPTSLDQTSCKAESSGSGTYSCSVTVGETTSSQGNINWSVTTDLGSGVTFSPAASGTISPGSPQTVTIGSIPCRNGSFTFSGQTGVTAISVPWSCTPPPTLSVSASSLDQNSANCSATGITYHCAVTLSAQGGTVNWSVKSDLGSSVTFTPGSGNLAPGNTMSVSIDAIPCQNGTFTFAGQTGVSSVAVPWSCTPTYPVVTVTPTSLDPTNPNCTLTGTTYQCSVTVAESTSSQQDASWYTSATYGTFSPSSGTLSPGQAVTVTIASLPCTHAVNQTTFSFYNYGGFGSVNLRGSWSCTPAMLMITPSNIGPSSGSSICSGPASDGTYTCTVSLSESARSQVPVDWTGVALYHGVLLNPASGTLSPGQSVAVTMSSLPCGITSMNFSFNGAATTTQGLWTCATPSAVLLIKGASNLDPTSPNCTLAADGTYTCAITLQETADSSGPIENVAYGDIAGLTFNPPEGTFINPGQSETMTISSLPCHYIDIYFGGGNLKPEMTWTCPPTPALTVTPTSLDTANTNCSATAGTYQCAVTLSSEGGTVNWSVASDLGSAVTFSPAASGTVSPGSPVTITIGSIPCQNGTFTFAGQSGVSPLKVPWSCAPPPPSPTLTVTPTSLDPTNTNCSVTSNTYQCALTLSAQGDTVNWSAITDLGSSVTFGPAASGTVSPGSPVKVTIGSIPCQNGTFTLSGQTGVSPVTISWSCTPPPTLSASVSSLDQSSANCSATGSSYHCNVTLNAQGGMVNWSVKSDLGSAVTFTPASGSLASGNSASISIDAIPCQNGTFTFSGQTGISPVAVAWNCTPPPSTLTVTPTTVDPQNLYCSATGSTYQCLITLSSQATMNWVATSDLGSGVTFASSSGTLTAGIPFPLTIASIPCQNGTITFSDQAGVSLAKVPWSCTPPPPPTLTVSQTSLDQSNCTADGTSLTIYHCTVSVGETASSQGNINWSVSTDLGSSVTFTPSNGTVSPTGIPASVTIGSIPCQNGTFTFAGQTGVIPISVSWSCTPPPVLTVAPTSLDQSSANCSPTGSSYHCTVNLSSQGGTVNWSATTDLGSAVTFTQASGSVAPGNIVSVSIDGIPCRNGTFTFAGQAGVSSVPVSWGCTPTTLSVTPTSLNQNITNCSATGSTYHCDVSLSAQGGTVNWSVTTDLGTAVTFTQASGSVAPGNTVSVGINAIPCQNGTFTFSGQSGVSSVAVPWSCTTATLTTNPSSFIADTSACSSSYVCTETLTLAETANSQGNVNWTVNSDLPAINYNGVTGGAGGTLSSGQSVTLSITNIPCMNGTFTFYGGASPVTVPWTCIQLTASPKSLSPSSSACSLDQSGATYHCFIDLAHLSATQSSITVWGNSYGVGSPTSPPTFNPQPIPLLSSPQLTTRVEISNIDGQPGCPNGEFIFGGQGALPPPPGVLPVTVPWTCPPSGSTIQANISPAANGSALTLLYDALGFDPRRI